LKIFPHQLPGFARALPQLQSPDSDPLSWVELLVAALFGCVAYENFSLNFGFYGACRWR